MFGVSILIFWFFSAQPALAWGSVTHVEINRRAGGGGDAFLAGGHSADMIALRHVTTGNAAYDYAHNDEGGNASFGLAMAETVTNTRHPERYGRSDAQFASGWAAHQLADGIAHGPDGYATNKAPFKGLPERFRPDLNHGVTEFLVDAIVLALFDAAPPAAAYHTTLIHEASVRFYNERVPEIRRDALISCARVEELTYLWEGWTTTNTYLVRLAAAQPWFDDVIDYYRDFRRSFDRSVARIRSARPAGLLGRLLSPFTGAVARAAEQVPPESGYLRFVMRVTERARRLNGGVLNDDAIRRALDEIIREDLAGGKDEEVKVWAKMMQEMFLKDNRSFDQIVENTQKYARRLRPEGKSVV